MIESKDMATHSGLIPCAFQPHTPHCRSAKAPYNLPSEPRLLFTICLCTFCSLPLKYPSPPTITFSGNSYHLYKTQVQEEGFPHLPSLLQG